MKLAVSQSTGVVLPLEMPFGRHSAKGTKNVSHRYRPFHAQVFFCASRCPIVEKSDIPAEQQNEFAGRLEEAWPVWDNTKNWKPEEATKRLDTRKVDWEKLVALSIALDDFLSDASWSIKDGL